MSRWSEVFESHPIHQTLSQSKEYLSTEVEGGDLDFEDERRRLIGVVDNLCEIVGGMDSEFYPKQWLDQLNQHMRHQNFLNQLQSYATSPGTSHLRTANDHITQYAPQVFHISSMSRPVESRKVLDNTRKAFESFSDSMDSAARRTDERFSEYEAEFHKLSALVKSLEQEVEALEESADSKLSEWQEEFTSKQTSRAEEYSAAKIKREEEIESQFSEWRDTIEKQRAGIEAVQEGKLHDTLESFKKVGSDVIKDVKIKHEEVKELHKLVGRDSVAGGYQSSAGEEGRQADLWRIVSLVCLVITAVWLVIKYRSGFAPIEGGGVNWPELITAASLTAIFLYAASYTSRQSKMHRDNEKQLRSYALETKALDPFIADLERDEQQAIKAELVRRMFGQQAAQRSLDRPALDDGTVKTLVEKVSDTVKETVVKVIDKN